MIIKNYAVINNQTNIVENVVVWDGENEWLPPEGTYVICIDGAEAGIGWKYENNTFIDVRPVAEETPT